jgi:lipopolysaccharide/colanic/teichoic acid biosynthesis glycosyltransferase
VLLSLAPLFLILALLIKIDSPKGPIFFVQTRVGYNRRHFKMLKFRTMVPDAERLQPFLEHLNEAQGPVFKIKNDPRITRIGRILRKTSLDELPQLFNVIKGDMSLVGPRPLPLRDVERFEEAWLKRRFSVKPGMTCLWQISERSNTTFDKWIAQDLAYIDNWSFYLDLKILCKTIPAVVRGLGAH